MKYKFTFCLFLQLLTFSVLAQSLAALDKKNGFKDYHLGTSISDYGPKSHAGFQVDDEAGNYLSYCESFDINKTLFVGDMQITSVNLYSFEGKLIRINVAIKDNLTAEFVKLYTSLYGKPIITYGNSKFNHFKNYVWRGKNTKLVIKDITDNYAKDASSTIAYISLPLLQKLLQKDTDSELNLRRKRINDL